MAKSFLNLFQKKRPTSVSVLSFEPRQVSYCQYRSPENIPVHLESQGSIPLDDLGVQLDPEVVGRLLAERFSQEEIREKHWTILLSMEWVFTCRVEVPQLAEEDYEPFLLTQAERHFPFPAEDLVLATSRSTAVSGENYAFLVALPKQRLQKIQKTLEIAQIQADGIELDLGSLHFRSHWPEESCLILQNHPFHSRWIVVHRRELIGLRTLTPGGSLETLYREAKISLAELPESLQLSLKTLYIWTPDPDSSPDFPTTENCFSKMGLPCWPWTPNADIPLSAAKDSLLEQRSPYQFLPVKVHPLHEWLGKASHQKNRWLGLAIGSFLGLLILGFGWQSWRLNSLNSRWNGMRDNVAELEVIQEHIRMFRPWHESSPKSLLLIKSLTQAFPDSGDIWVKELNIKDPALVYCSGSAKDNRVWLDMLDRLQGSSEVKNLMVDHVRGESPLQFTFQYLWEEDRNHE